MIKVTPEQHAIVVRERLLGKTQREIGALIGVDQSTVHDILKRPQVKQVLEREFTQLMQRGLIPARKTLCRLAAMGLSKRLDKDFGRLALDASKTILSHAQGAPGTVINNLIQVNMAPQEREEIDDVVSFLEHTWSNRQQNIREEDVIDAIKKGKVEEGHPIEHMGTDPLRQTTETGGGDSIESGRGE